MKRLFLALSTLVAANNFGMEVDADDALFGVPAAIQQEEQRQIEGSLLALAAQGVVNNLESYEISKLLSLAPDFQDLIADAWIENNLTNLNEFGCSNWILTQTLKSSSKEANKDFGVSVSMSSSGHRLVSALKDNIDVWIIDSHGKLVGNGPITTLEDSAQGFFNDINLIGISADGKKVVSGISNNQVKVWNLDEGGNLVEVKTLDQANPRVDMFGLSQVVISADGRKIAASYRDKSLKVWSLDAVGNWVLSAALNASTDGHIDWVNSVAISADGRRVVSGSSDKTVKVWNLDEEGRLIGGGPMATLDVSVGGHTESVSSVSISGDGRRVVSGSSDKTVKVWNLDEEGRLIGGGPVATLSFLVGGNVNSMHPVFISANGRRIVTGSENGAIKVWNLSSDGRLIGNGPVATLKASDGYVRSISMSADGRRIVSTSRGNINVWDLVKNEDCKLTLPIIIYAYAKDRLKEDEANFIAREIDFNNLHPSILKFLSKNEIKDTAPGKDSLGFVGREALLGVSPENILSLLGVYSLEQLLTLSDDVQSLIVNSWIESNLKRLNGIGCEIGWSLIQTLDASTVGIPRSFAVSVSISADGRRVASGSWDNAVKIWNLNMDGTLVGAGPITTLDASVGGHTAPVRSVSISADGRRVVSGSWDNTVKIWNLNMDGTLVGVGPIATLDVSVGGHAETVGSVSISADGRRVVSGSWDNTVKIWNLNMDGTLVGVGPIATLDVSVGGHAKTVDSVSISADGRRVVSGSLDNTVKIWNLNMDGTLVGVGPIATLDVSVGGHAKTVDSVSISADGRRVVSGSLDTIVKIWNLNEDEVLDGIGPVATAVGSWRLNNMRTRVDISANGRGVALGYGNMLKALSLNENGKIIDEVYIDRPYGLKEVISVAISSDGKRVISSFKDATIKIWNLIKKEDLNLTLPIIYAIEKEQLTKDEVSLIKQEIKVDELHKNVKQHLIDKGILESSSSRKRRRED